MPNQQNRMLFMRSLRRNGIFAVFLWSAHVIIVLVLNRGQLRTFLSDFIQLAIGILTVSACIKAAQRSARFGRMFWTLASAAFSLLATGLALGTYNDIFVASPMRHPWLVDMFTNSWVAPLVMCLLLDPETEPEGRDWQRVLDFSQVGIVFVLLYLYSSNFALPGPGFQPWRLAFITDGLITFGFFLRGLTSRWDPARKLFRQFAYFRLVAVATDSIFMLHLMPEPPAGERFDVVWSLTILIPLLIADAWNDPKEYRLAPESGISDPRLLVTQLMPLIFPVLVMLTAAQIARGQLALAAAAVLASLAITFARLLLMQGEQRRSTEALRRSHRLLDAIMEGANEAIFIKDIEGRYVTINTPGAQMLGRSVLEVIGKNDFELFPATTARRLKEADEQVIQSRSAQTYEFTTTLGGVIHSFLTTKSPYIESQSNMTGVIGISLDITERRKLEEQLRQTQKMEAVGKLAGGVAHDFNNLLTVIRGYSHMVLDKEHDPELRSHAERIDEAAEHAAALTTQLLAFSRQQVLQPKVIDLNALIQNLDKMLRRLIGEDVEIATTAVQGLWSVKADPAQIEQVVMNLAVNARDAMPNGGKLTLETANVELDENYSREHAGICPGDYAMLAVSDTGIGMDTETQSRVFEPFFTTKDMGKGTGLGLSMVYGIVRQSGGNIWVYSEPGRGTTFKIYLPRVDASTETVVAQERPTGRLGGDETILIVEDDQKVRELAQTVLATGGYSVLVADSALGASSLCEQHIGPIHLLLTDVVLPGISGREIARQAVSLRPGMKVLYMSGYTTNAIVHRGELDKRTSFLPKPFTPNTLCAKVREVLDSPTASVATNHKN